MKIEDAHILFAVPVLTGGGAERVVAVLASGMAEKGIKTSILVNKRCEKEYPISEKVQIYSLPAKYAATGNLIHKLKKTYARYRLMKKINPDIILPFLAGVLEPSFLCNLFLHKKFVSTIRVNPRISEGHGLKIRDFIISCSTACFVQNEEQKAYFSNRIQKKTFVVPNPISDRFMGGTRDYSKKPLIVVTAGRLQKQKNQSMLIYAMKEVHKVHPEIRTKIYGEGAEYNNLEKLIKENRLENVIELCGRSEDMRSVYEQADIFVLTSDFEGMPNALMEAMAMGLPCVSTDCPTGPKDLIRDTQNGMLIPVGNVEKLEQSLLMLYEDDENRKKMGTNAQNDMKENYTTSAVVELLCHELDRYI